jgi:hypothetical protein
MLATAGDPSAVSVPTFGPRMVCTRCGIVGADARPNWREQPTRESLTGACNGKPSFVVWFVITDLGLIAGLICVELATARTVKAGERTCGRDIPIRDYWAILLDAGRPQPGEAVAINRTLPVEKFLDRQHIETAGIFE